MTRVVTVGAAQLGPVARDESRADVVERLIALLREGAGAGCRVVAFPELALTTFFPRWYTEELSGHDHYFETEMPGPETKPLFDDAAARGVGFALGYAELTPDGRRFNTTVLVDGHGSIVGTYRKTHVPGHDTNEPWRPFQHLERRYFEESHEGFHVWDAFGGRFGIATCNDRRWPESYREMGLQGVEMILIGYNTPIHYAPDPGQDRLQGFHNHLVMQAGAYQNGTWVVGVAKGGVEEGVEMLAESAIIAPSGEIVAQATTDGDELVVAEADLDWCNHYRGALFDFEKYRRPEMYRRIAAPKGEWF
jgi:predicted amidohydrolase